MYYELSKQIIPLLTQEEITKKHPISTQMNEHCCIFTSVQCVLNNSED